MRELDSGNSYPGFLKSTLLRHRHDRRKLRRKEAKERGKRTFTVGQRADMRKGSIMGKKG